MYGAVRLFNRGFGHGVGRGVGPGERGLPLFRNGLRFDADMERAGQRGFRPVRQIVIDKAEGDFVWDLDGKRYIDFQNGWATNPLGNCHPEILEAVEAANRLLS